MVDSRLYNSAEWWTPEDIRALLAESRLRPSASRALDEREEQEEEENEHADSDATGFKVE